MGGFPKPAVFVVATVLLAPSLACGQADTVKAPTRSRAYERRTFTSKEGDPLPYWLLAPATVEEGKTYPLVLALHGRGGNTEAATVLGTADMRRDHPCFVMAPAVSRREVWAVPGGFRKLPGKARIPAALEALEAFIEDHPVDRARIYVTGQSMGGFGSFGAVAARPDLFAAAMPVCGGWDPKDAAKMKGVAFWIFHGGADRTVPVEMSRAMVKALEDAGAKPEFTEYPGVGHNSWSRTYADAKAWTWLFAQVRAQ